MVNILIVEDDKMISRLYKKALELSGYQVVLANNGKEGLDRLKENSPDLILLDIMMPVMNGMEFLKSIKENSKTKKIPVVVLTNLAGRHDAEHAISQGSIKYIIKSEHDPSAVVKIIGETLES